MGTGGLERESKHIPTEEERNNVVVDDEIPCDVDVTTMGWQPCSYEAVPENDPEIPHACGRATGTFMQTVHDPIDSFMFFMNEKVWQHIARCTDARRKNNIEEITESPPSEYTPRVKGNRNDTCWEKKKIEPNRIMVFVALLMQNTLHHFPEGKY
jgi:hypothetical protein